MALFRRTRVAAPEEPLSVSEEFQRLSIRESLIFLSWWEENFFIHLEKDGRNVVKAYINSSWYAIDVPSRSAGTAMMQEIRTDWSSAKKSGLLPEQCHLNSYAVKSLGFAEVSFNEFPEEFTSDFVFTLGRDLVDKVEAGWFPQSNTDLSLLFNYFRLAPIRVGFFGQYKYILKAITNEYPQQLPSMTPEYASHIAAAIGFGYGHLEGFISHANRSPQSDDWNMDALRHLPELNGFLFPRLKTIQYLLRKGWRFLDYLEVSADPLITTRFMTHVLRGADDTHQDTELPEERYLQYQQLTTRIIYGAADLAIRDRESRKVVLGPRYDRHNLAASKKFIASLSANQLQAYKNWMAELSGRNTAVTLHALSLSQVIQGSEFNWTASVVRTLFNSESEIARTEIKKAINQNPSLLRSIPQAALAEYIDTVDSKIIDKILDEIKSVPWMYTVGINHWVSSHLNRKLSEIELKIAIAFLVCAWDSIENDIWRDETVLKRDTLFFQVARQTKLEPFSQWRNTVRIYRHNEADLLGFYGVAKHPRYQVGLLDVVDIRNEEMLLHFAQSIIGSVQWGDNEKVIRILSAFYNSSKIGASDLVWTILGRQMLAPEKQEAFLEYLNSMDPSGVGYLRGISSAIDLKDQRAVLTLLINLSAESKDSFWRRNKAEMQSTLMSWKDFPIFMWNNLEKIPASTLEKFRKYEGLQSKVLKQITPASIARMSPAQVEYFVFMVSENPSICSNVSLLRAMLVAPSAAINGRAAAYVKSENKYGAHWLLMLESNLPISQQSALRYLESQIETKDFSVKLLMALDSNNQAARKLALSVLSTIQKPSVLSSVIDGLVENRNSDTWKVVSNNLELVSSVDKYKEFTSQVFLTRRKARSVKEELKTDIEDLIEDISEAVEKDTLIRMAHSSIAADRAWALKQIALTGIEIDGVTVERAWKGNLNV